MYLYFFSGRILTGVVRKQKMQRTIIIRRDYLHFVKKYGRFEKRHNVSYYICVDGHDLRLFGLDIAASRLNVIHNLYLEHGRPYVTSFLGC